MQQTLPGTYLAAFFVFVMIAVGTALSIATALDTSLTHQILHPELLQAPTMTGTTKLG